MTEPANDNSPRPAEFDARLMSHLPLIRKVASACSDPADRDDLVNDAVEHALKHWTSFRPEGGFSMWLQFIVRSIASGKLKKQGRRQKRMPRVYSDIAMERASTPATQLDHVELVQTLNRLQAQGRDGDVLLRRAMGEEQLAIGARHGISKERVRQLEARARTNLTKAAA